MDWAELKARKRPRIAAHPVLLDPQLLVELGLVEQRLAASKAIEKRQDLDMSQGSEVPALEERRDSLLDEIEENTAMLHLRSLPGSQWSDLIVADEYAATPIDVEMGMDVNWRRLTPDLLAVSCFAVTTGLEEPDEDAWQSVEFFDEEAAAEFVADMSQGEQESLFRSLRDLNVGSRSVPLNRRGSAGTGRSAPKSNTHANGASPTQKSAVG